MSLRETLSNTWDHVQGFLFPMLREEIGPLTAQHQRLVVVLEVAGVEAFVRTWPGLPGRLKRSSIRMDCTRGFIVPTGY
jgi:hypothetical protein